jgi:hypothetical protein
MSRTFASLLVALFAVVAIGCNTATAPSSSTALSSALTSSFASLPIGFSFVPSTFAGGTAADSDGWAPPEGPGAGQMGPGGDHGDHGDGDHDGVEFDGESAGGSMMCGGLGGAFRGDGLGLGLGFGRRLFGGVFAGTALPGTCLFDATSGRVVCDTITHDGMSIVRSAAYTDASGAVQPAFDSLTTNTINVRVSVTGTKVRRHDTDTSAVQHASDRTVSGLAPGSTQRTVNGTSTGLETVKGTNRTGSFTAVRTIGDTVTGIVIPVRTDSVTFPTAGTVIRASQVTLTYSGQAPTTSTRREVVTYDGTSTATIVITQNGTTRNCTMTLPHGRLVCA